MKSARLRRRLSRRLQYLFASVALVAMSCDRSAPFSQERADASTAPVTAAHEAPRSAADRSRPERIVSLSPSTTEILFAVGAGPRVVGRTKFCDFPPEVAALPIVGGFVDANLEEILRRSPDLVVGARGPGGPALVEKFSSLGVATLFPSTQSIAEVEGAIIEIATRVGAAAGGETVVAAMRARRNAIAAAIAGERRVRTLLVFGLNPVVAAGPASFASEMLISAGGENVVTSGGAYPALNAETLVALDPDVVINGAAAGAGGEHRGIDPNAPGWRALRAVRTGRVVPLTDEAALRPGPRTSEGIATLARILHPQAKIPRSSP